MFILPLDFEKVLILNCPHLPKLNFFPVAPVFVIFHYFEHWEKFPFDTFSFDTLGKKKKVLTSHSLAATYTPMSERQKHFFFNFVEISHHCYKHRFSPQSLECFRHSHLRFWKNNELKECTEIVHIHIHSKLSKCTF